MQDFRKLRVWEEGQRIAVLVRRATRRFPRAGYTALRSQMIRAAESIVLTIVEGCGASSPKEFARFLEMAIKSASELEAAGELARSYGILRHHEWQELTDAVVAERRMVFTLRNRVLGHPDPPPKQPRTDD